MAGVLTFSQYIGGPDQLIMEQSFPSSQRSVIYNYGVDVSTYTFSAEYQTVVVDAVTFNRNTGAPNFANSNVIGTFPKVDVTGSDVPSIINSTAGTVVVNFPANMYTGPLYPDARKNVPIVVFGFTWNVPNVGVTQILVHRWAFMQAWEPGVTPGDPTTQADYTGITI